MQELSVAGTSIIRMDAVEKVIGMSLYCADIPATGLTASVRV